jgi:hypothetical protein
VTTYREHAQIYRKIVNLNNGGGFLPCMLLDCERPGLANYVVVEHKHGTVAGVGCDEWAAFDAATHIRLPFCSERHKTMYVEGSGWRANRLIQDRGHAFGFLPTGSRGMMS